MTALTGSTALVTGAGRGIGADVAVALAEAGAEVVLVARSLPELTEVAEGVRRRGGRARADACDLTDLTAVDALVGRLDRLDVLVNNAGTDQPTAFPDVTSEVFDDLLAVNLRTAFFLTQRTLPLLSVRGGSVVNLSSQLALVGAAWESAYCAAKAGVDGLTRALAIELAPRRIRVNAVAPTVVSTPRTEAALADPSLREAILARIPLGRFASGRDVATAVRYLAGPESAMVTGVVLPVDGGWIAQ